tara:strand:+ start:130 stop:243 length:114 start_codon:yes stop_codon:yes gene_type:complete
MGHRLDLKLMEFQDLQKETAFIDIGLKGTKVDGNVRK